jgi:hypothetical protein
MNLLILTLLALAIIFSTFSFYTQCPKCKDCGDSIKIQEKSSTLLDLQFSPKNFPSLIYDNLFTQPNPFLGGYRLADTGRQTIKEQIGISVKPLNIQQTILKSG